MKKYHSYGFSVFFFKLKILRDEIFWRWRDFQGYCLRFWSFSIQFFSGEYGRSVGFQNSWRCFYMFPEISYQEKCSWLGKASCSQILGEIEEWRTLQKKVTYWVFQIDLCCICWEKCYRNQIHLLQYCESLAISINLGGLNKALTICFLWENISTFSVLPNIATHSSMDLLSPKENVILSWNIREWIWRAQLSHCALDHFALISKTLSQKRIILRNTVRPLFFIVRSLIDRNSQREQTKEEYSYDEDIGLQLESLAM